MYEAEIFFIEKLRKFPFEIYIVLNKKYKILLGKKIIEKCSKKVRAWPLINANVHKKKFSFRNL